MFGFGTQELLIIVLLLFLIFAGNKLPQIGLNLGKGIRKFKQGVIEEDSTSVNIEES